MKKLILTLCLFVVCSMNVFAQCTPDVSITDPGIYPDTIVNLPPTYVGAAYNTSVQVNVLTDTVVPQGNVVVDDITLDNVTGLPAGFNYACNPANCVFPSGQTTCLAVTGTATIGQVGTYSLIINVTLHGRLFGVFPVSSASQILGYKIRILGPPVSNFSGTPTSICKGSSVLFTDQSSNEPTSWAWSFPGGTPSSSNLQIPPSVVYNTTGNKNVTLNVTSPAGNNSLTKTSYIVVNAIPAAIVTPSGTVTVCSGTSTLLSANTVTGASYQWIRNNVDIGGATSGTYLATTTGNYKVRVTKTSTGCNKTSAATIISNESLTASVSPSGATTFCSGGSVTLNASATGTSPFTYLWYKGVNPIGGATGTSYNVTISGTYKVLVTSVNGCTKFSSSIVVTVNPKPAATIVANGPTTFCVGGSVVLQANQGAGYVYQWKKNNVNINGATNIQYSATTTGTYKVLVTNANGCTKTSNTINVTVNGCREIENLAAAHELRAIVFPNPSQSETTVEFDIEIPEHVSIRLFDLAGKELLIISENKFEAGNHAISFSTSKLGSGVYFVRLDAGNKNKAIKLIVD